MIKINTRNPDKETIVLKPGFKSETIENEFIFQCLEGLFDKRITNNGLRSLYRKLQHYNLPLYIEEDMTFGSKLRDFLIAIQKLEKQIEIFSINKEFLKELNYVISSQTKQNKILIIDTHNFYHRNFHALPEMYNKEGEPTRLLKALTTLFKWIDSQDYTNIVFASESEKNLRKIFTQKTLGSEQAYKGTRKEIDPLLKKEIGICDKFLKDINFEVLKSSGYEADDVIASVTKEFLTKDPLNEAHIFTGDKDLLQLLTFNNCKIIDVKTKQLLGPEYLEEKYEVMPEQFVDYQAIVGDTSDNVLGVPGIGKTGAKNLLQEFSSLENIIENIESIEKKNVQNKMKEGIQSALISKDLVIMRQYLFEDTIDFSYFSKKFYDINSIIKNYLNKFDIKY